MAERDIVPQPQDFATVGSPVPLDRARVSTISPRSSVRRTCSSGHLARRRSRTNFTWPELVTVTDLASAHRAVDTILEQGEGARGHWEHAHFGQFVQILDEYREMHRREPRVRPRAAGDVRDRPACASTTRPCRGSRERVTSRVGDLFNVSYEILLQIFERYFAHTEETDEQLGTLADATVALMLRVLKPLGNLITTLPVGPAFPGMNAGPSFELFYENDYLMPHREAAWALLEERIREAATFCGLIQEIAPRAGGRRARAGAAGARRRGRLARRPLRGVGGEKQVRARSPRRDRARADGQAAKALSRRAASLARAVDSADGTTAGAKRLI